jgi:phosphotransferase system, enzyme I, PtsP
MQKRPRALSIGSMVGSSSSPSGASRHLLRSLREVMEQASDTQARLDRIVVQISRAMVADVCSVYLRRTDGAMELYATEGLSRDAVHRTRMKPGEGLVGLVAEEAEPVALSDASSHPRFSYRPETGEDPYQTFLGVPLLRSGRVIGVLTVQNLRARTYPDDDIEALRMIAAFFAEQLPDQDSSAALAGFDIRPTGPETVNGKRFSGGLAKGPALLHDPTVEPTRLLADDPAVEEDRISEGLRDLRRGLERLLTGDVQSLGGEPYEVLETFHLLSMDVSWERRLVDGVRAGLTAEAAVEQVRSEHRAKMNKAKDGYLRDRLQDLEELDNRLLRHLAGGNEARDLGDREGLVLVARDIGAAELLEYGRAKIAAVVLEEGSPSAHAAIIARAMGIPMLGQLKSLLSRVEAGDPIIVDATSEVAYIRPDQAVAIAFGNRFAAQEAERAELAALRDLPAKSKDGQDISLLLNAGLPLDLDSLAMTGAQGVGLFRTEFQFMLADSMPRLDTQIALYSEVVERANGLPVTFRTLDLGGDKVAAFIPTEREENPAMGWRAVRMGLDRPGLSRYQLRALVRACEGKSLRVMFPLVSVIDEFRKAKALLEQELGWAKFHGRQGPKSVAVGVMIESPSLAWMCGEIAKEADFLSIGTNDLMQFFFAADRGSPKMADRYDLLSRPALTFIDHILTSAGDTPVSICGEHAGRPLEALALLALGVTRLSMPAAGIGPVKRMILSLDLAAAKAELRRLLCDPEVTLRSALQEFAEKQQIPL